MTENGRPRHLHDLTAEMPAIKLPPRHSADTPPPPYTSAIPRINADRTQYPPLPAQWRPAEEPPAPSVRWWTRAWRWLTGA